jgi:hypothetical protein
MDKMEQVTYCGLYCGLCTQRNRIPRQADELRETMHKEGWDFWGTEQSGFKEFWEFLNKLAKMEENCSCRLNKCGPPFCGIRNCAQSKAVEVCVFCEDYPCYRIEGLCKGYVNLLGDAKRIKEKGLEKWIEEQEERRKTGFAYTDIRNHPYEVPDK